MYAIATQIKAQDIQPGMVIDIYNSERVAVERVVVKWGAVQIRDHADWRGLAADETVTVAGYFNP